MATPSDLLPVEAIPVPVICYTPETCEIQSANTLFANLVQLPLAQLQGKVLHTVLFDATSCATTPCSSLASPKDALPTRGEFLQDKSSSSVSSNIFTSQVIECNSPSGVNFSASFTVNFEDPKLVVLAVQRSAPKMTEKDKVEDTQKETSSEQEFLRRLEDFPAMLYTYRRFPNGKQLFTYASAGSRLVWNMTPEEITAEDGAEKLMAAVVDHERLVRSVQRNNQTSKTWKWTGQFNVPDADDPSKTNPRWLRAISKPKKLEDGSVQWDGSVFDVTKEKQQRAQILSAQRRIAKEKERAKLAQQFSELLSHEVRNPLASIDSCALLTLNSIDSLVKELSLNENGHKEEDATSGNGYLMDHLEAIRKDIAQVVNCTDYLKCVVENTLDLVKLRSHRLELNSTVVDLERDVLTPTIQMFQKTPGAVKIYSVCTSGIRVRCDPFRIKQILVNLVNNGIKHTRNGHIRLVATRTSPQSVNIAVEDTGSGIPPEQQGKVFVKYERGTENSSGHGIGLSLCQELVEKMGGQIRVDPSYSSSTHGIGTRIEISLPFEEAELEFATYESKDNQAPELPSDISVLICDDSEMSQTLMKRRLAAHSNGWSFDLCHTGEAAVEAAKWKQYGLIVIDQNLDDGGGNLRGHETMRKLRDEVSCKAPIIGCSASELTGVHLDSGADLVWRKPLPNDNEMAVDLLRVLNKDAVRDSKQSDECKRRKLE